MVAVDGGGHGRLGPSGLHELKERHLRGGVLHGNTVGTQAHIALAALELGRFRVVEVTEDYLVGKRERPAQPLADGVERGLASSVY